jgi:hypothetical protein
MENDEGVALSTPAREGGKNIGLHFGDVYTTRLSELMMECAVALKKQQYILNSIIDLLKVKGVISSEEFVAAHETTLRLGLEDCKTRETALSDALNISRDCQKL